MNWNLNEMLITQQKVNDKVMEKLKTPPTAMDYLLAMHVEVFEFINSVGTWKWWKHSHVPNKVKILDELADVMAFFFSYVLVLDEQTQKSVPEILQEVYTEIEGYDTPALLQYITQNVNDGNEGMNALVLMAICVVIAGNTVNATWQEIEEAYAKKSKVNIERQENNY